MLNLIAFTELVEATAQYHRDLLVLENNLDVSMESNWMTRIMDRNVRALSRAFHSDTQFYGRCYNELTSVQVEKIEELLQYLIYSWDGARACPQFVVYERTPAQAPAVQMTCQSIEGAYKIIVDYVEHLQDDVTWKFEELPEDAETKN